MTDESAEGLSEQSRLAISAIGDLVAIARDPNTSETLRRDALRAMRVCAELLTTPEEIDAATAKFKQRKEDT